MTGPADPAAQRRTKAGTPMIGPYSINQMDDFYAALAVGEVRSSGVMNYLQHLYVAQRCPPGATVVDVCCGRGLQLPVLCRYASHIDGYVGLDVAPAHLEQARQRIAVLDRAYDRAFRIDLIECDVAEPWPALPPCDVAVYTSALEHLPREQGIASLRHTAAALAPAGRLYLSTPSTPAEEPRRLQYGVHVYEWDHRDLSLALAQAGLVIDDLVGLLPPDEQQLAEALERGFGEGAARWYERLREIVPAAFLDAVAAAAVPDVAAELLYVCSPRIR